MTQRGLISAKQYTVLMRPLAKTRVAKRSQGGKQLSYLEAWDVKAHLTRLFGFGNWDSEVIDYHHIATREYMGGKDNDKEMVEVIYAARVQLTIRDENGGEVCRHSEVAVGSTSGPANMLGEHHDNAVKTAASDAIKRCAINLGTQFGLSLYDNGATNDIVKMTVVVPEGYEALQEEATEKQKQALQQSLGAQQEKQEEAKSA